MAENKECRYTERFKTVFLALEKKGKIKRGRRKGAADTLKQFAEKIWGKPYGSLVSDIFKGKRKFPMKHIRNLCHHYAVNFDYMMQGEGGMFDTTPFPVEAEALQDGPRGNILFSNMEAMASDSVGASSPERLAHFSIPGVEGNCVAFYVKGNSMYPTIGEGDMVICHPVESIAYITEDDIYAVATHDGRVMIKRLKHAKTRYNEESFILISDNYLEHLPFEVAKHEIRAIYKVEKRLTGLGL